MRRLALAVLAVLVAAPARATPEPAFGRSGLKVPRFASLRAGDVNMRSGPGTPYPIVWNYRRKGLPVEVVREWGPWRMVRDPDGDAGWVDQAMIAGERTGYVTRTVRTLYDRPDIAARAIWRVAPGVVGHLILCDGGWCELSVDGRSGYLPRAQLFGTYVGERVG